MQKNQRLLKILLIILSFSIAVAAVVLIKALPFKKEQVIYWQKQIEETAQTETTEEETERTEESSTEELSVVYTAPDYDFQTEEVIIEISGLTHEYTLAWVSDLHMITDFKAAEDVMEEFMEDIELRYESLFVTDDGVYSADLWPEIVKFLNYGNFDGIIFGGDIMDYCSKSNMNTFMEGFEQLDKSVPLMYIRADHDYGFWYGGKNLTEPDAHELHKTIDGDNLNDKFLDFEEFIIVGVNGSTKDMPSYQYDIISQQYDLGKPVIAVTHVPYASYIDDSLEELSMLVRNKVYYWGGGEYVPNDVTSNYLDMIYSNGTLVCEVLAGHLHAEWDGMITQYVSQHIFTPAYMGYIGIVHVVPGEKD